MEHTYLIHQANALEDSIERMKVKKNPKQCTWPLIIWKHMQNPYSPNMLNNNEIWLIAN